MKTTNSNVYIAPKVRVIATHTAEIVCTSLGGSTNNESYTEEVYEW